MDLRAASSVIDGDIHCVVPSIASLLPYLPTYWQEQIRQTGFQGPVDDPFQRAGLLPSAAQAPPAAPAGSDLKLTREQVLDAWQVAYGILTCTYAVDSLHNPDAALAVARAVNDWQRAEWLDQEPRLRASIVVPIQQPELAIQEIKRVGRDPRFVQVLLPVHSSVPYGNRRFHPVFAAAAEHDLVVALHFGGAPGNPPTPSGWPSFYIEAYAGMASLFQSQLLSLVAEGVFDQFPALRVALVESGWTWLPSLMWRFDKEWRGLRREVPWVSRPPSDYIREHVRLTIQPCDAPPRADRVLQLIDQIGSEELLMFATAYPHESGNQWLAEVIGEFPDGLARKIMYENARAFYRS
jgi:uncharacterized protein